MKKIIVIIGLLLFCVIVTPAKAETYLIVVASSKQVSIMVEKTPGSMTGAIMYDIIRTDDVDSGIQRTVWKLTDITVWNGSDDLKYRITVYDKSWKLESGLEEKVKVDRVLTPKEQKEWLDRWAALWKKVRVQ